MMPGSCEQTLLLLPRNSIFPWSWRLLRCFHLPPPCRVLSTSPAWCSHTLFPLRSLPPAIPPGRPPIAPARLPFLSAPSLSCHLPGRPPPPPAFPSMPRFPFLPLFCLLSVESRLPRLLLPEPSLLASYTPLPPRYLPCPLPSSQIPSLTPCLLLRRMPRLLHLYPFSLLLPPVFPVSPSTSVTSPPFHFLLSLSPLRLFLATAPLELPSRLPQVRDP